MDARRPQPRQRTLDVVRGVAILMVIAFHLDAATGIPAIDVLRPIVRAGWAGVDLFFVLSGFLVGRIILAEASATGGFGQARFFGRRILRLWPALGVYLAALLALGSGAVMVVPVVLHVQNYADTAPSHLWSLAVEEHFYLAAAFALPWLARGGGRRVIAAMLGVIAACLLLRLLALHEGAAFRSVQWQTQYRIDALATGVLLAAVQRYRPRLYAAIARRRGGCLLVAVGGFALLTGWTDGTFRYGVGLSVAEIAAAAFVVALESARIPASLAWPARVLAALGTIAYSLYIWHASIARVVEGMAPTIGSPALVLLLKYAAAIGWSALMYAAIERPTMRWRDRKARGANGIKLLRNMCNKGRPVTALAVAAERQSA